MIVTTCRYRDRWGERCTAEVVEENAEIDLCTRHLAAALALLQRRVGPHVLVITGEPPILPNEPDKLAGDDLPG